jgi:outer membrane protein assembly factor BamE (lipoprotein component of BamABCDE complex)
MKTLLADRGKAALLGLAGILCLAACVRIGQPFPTQRVPSIEIGKSTKDDVSKIFGQPFRTGLEDGDTTWTYVNYRLAVFGSQCTQDLVVRFGPGDVVKSYAYNTSAEESCPHPTGTGN